MRSTSSHSSLATWVRNEEALTANEKALRHYRELAATNPDASADLGRSTTSQSTWVNSAATRTPSSQSRKQSLTTADYPQRLRTRTSPQFATVRSNQSIAWPP